MRMSTSNIDWRTSLGEGSTPSKFTEQQPYKFDRYGVTHNWTKQSIFWQLSYFKDNFLQHNIDLMHIEKKLL